MTSPSSSACQSRGQKRAYPYPSSDESSSPTNQSRDAPSRPDISLASASHAVSSAFRNVSACNRCRVRKNRCDQHLPACASCAKAHVKCVGYDPILKREIPRSYVYYLENRIYYLEHLLQSNNIAFRLPEAFEADWCPPTRSQDAQTLADDRPQSRQQQQQQQQQNPNGNVLIKVEPSAAGPPLASSAAAAAAAATDTQSTPTPTPADDAWEKKQKEEDKLNKLVSNIGMVSVQGASDPRYLGSTSGISFARVVFSAVKSSMSSSSSNSDRGGVKPGKPLPPGAGNASMRDSFFGLQSKPCFGSAPFPDRLLGERLVNLYFEHANPQIPTLHRGEFMTLFNRVYSIDEKSRTPRELYLLNIVFAIGAGIIFGATDEKPGDSPNVKRPRLPKTHQYQPEEYHASAIVHLEQFLGSGPASDRPDGFGGGLEELQAVLLLASFALLRPVAPGLWYIVGVADRLAIDLGLHYEDTTANDNSPEARLAKDTNMSMDVDMDMNANVNVNVNVNPAALDPRERGRREWVRDLRRRLWWCTYSFDRLVSTCVGRPFGISDQVITTQFPSVLDDKYITTTGFIQVPGGAAQQPSYKRVSHHYFRFRLLQSEILQVLQHQQAQQVLSTNAATSLNDFRPTRLPSPFLQRFSSFKAWRKDIDRRLYDWKESAPTQQETGVAFAPQFLELNYWQAVIMLYRQSLSVPPIANEFPGAPDVSSPSMMSVDSQEEEDDVFLRVAEAGQRILRLYRQLHRLRLVNYTYLATHHLFMAGISFLYAIWHSATVRARLTLDEVDFTVLAATSVLGDLISKCPPAEACRDAFERMSKATVQMCLSTTGFGSQASGLGARTGSQSQSPESVHDQPMMNNQQSLQQQSQMTRQDRRPPPRFDLNLRDLFTEESFNGNMPLAAQFNMAGIQGHQQLPMQQQPQPQPQNLQGFMPQHAHPMSPPIYSMGPPTTSSASTPPNGLPSPFAELSIQRRSPQQSSQHQSPMAAPPSRQQMSPSQQSQALSQTFYTTTNSSNASTPYPATTTSMDFATPHSFPVPDFINGSYGEQNGTNVVNNIDDSAGPSLPVSGISGLDLGFGLGTGLDLGDPSRDENQWGENTGIDLFDGYFFGQGNNSDISRV